MADTKTSAFPASAAALGPMELHVNNAGADEKLTIAQIQAYIASLATWKPLGSQVLASAAVRTPDIIWNPAAYSLLRFQYWIEGYAGNAIGRLIIGSGSLAETGTDCSCELIEGVTRNILSVSCCGWPTAVTLNASMRWGEFVVRNDAGSKVRHGYGAGLWGGSPTVPPTGMQMAAFKNTVAQIDRARLTSFSAITGNSTGANFNAGTFLKVFGAA